MTATRAASAPLSPLLVRLAQERATGALLRSTGVLYLSDGAVVHAESPSAPGIERLLTTGGRLPAEAWREAVDQAGAQCRIGHWLIDHRRLSAGEVEISQLGTLHDAAFFVLAPSGGPSRFRHGAEHWFGVVSAVPVHEVEREARRRRRLLDALWPHPGLDDAPLVRRPAARLPPVTRRQRALLDLADGSRTPAAIAAALGRPAFHTLVDVRRLAAAGHLAPPDGAPPTARAPLWFKDIGGDPDTAMLRRLRDALEHL
ncbi:transcriptional regulator [Streptomyces sp. NBC_01476]|uniref:transcriptional regulator n=1 Tax=Streptomyces sp. NBC_01476 TaxID=2903881 RepID=UPI002E31FE30|nr:transcriptional regulator [Streptomyces sp. NBC_01476]